jgi:uncharacterized protein YqeY
MKLEEKINEQLKAAIKSEDKTKMETLRSLRASIIEFNKSGVGRKMNPEDEIKLLKTAVKRRKDAIEMYKKGGRQELADKENAELEIISEFLPEQASEDEIKTLVQKTIQNVNAEGMKDMGSVMGPVMNALKGKADGNLVRQIVQVELGKL